jgi:hypothetical protein
MYHLFFAGKGFDSTTNCDIYLGKSSSGCIEVEPLNLLDRSYIKPVAQNILIAKRWNFLG